MVKLTTYREQQHLTQEQLAAKAGVSVRTIQRIEAGATPKGYTLQAIATALEIPKEKLLPLHTVVAKPNQMLVKWINLSCLVFLILPFGNIFLPLLIMYTKKEVNILTKQIVSIQIFWTLIVCLLMISSPFFIGWLSLPKTTILILLLGMVALNLAIILVNARSIHTHTSLCFKLPFRFL